MDESNSQRRERNYKRNGFFYIFAYVFACSLGISIGHIVYHLYNHERIQLDELAMVIAFSTPFNLMFGVWFDRRNRKDKNY